MKRVDERRIRFVGSLLLEGGVPAKAARLRARVIYAWAMGQMLISGEGKAVPKAMAEVLVKQDKLEQAIEMYEKLSLNYPAKSAYFAAKIKSLKSV